MLSILLSLTSIFKVYHFRKLIKGQFYRWRNLHKVFQVISWGAKLGEVHLCYQTAGQSTQEREGFPDNSVAFSKGLLQRQGRDLSLAVLWFPGTGRARAAHAHNQRTREQAAGLQVSAWLRRYYSPPKWCLLRCQSPFFPIPPLLHDQRPQIPPRGQRQHVEPEPPTPGYTELRSACRRSCFGRRIVAAMLSRATPTTGTGGGGGRSIGLWPHPFRCPQSLDVRPLGTFQDGSPHSEAVVSCGAESASASALLGRLVAVLLLWSYFFSHLRALP